jgi:monoamine oxidase
MTLKDPIIVIGAGVAGLAAACELGRAGLPVSVIEARERIGGRVFTIFDAGCDAPLELGAEFVHGLPPEICDLFRVHHTPIVEVDGDTFCVSKSGLQPCDFFSEVDSLLERMTDAEPDQSFLDWLKRQTSYPKDVRQHAVDYVSGFNAADPSLVGVHWLVQSMRAEERVHGDRVFRAKGGYASLIEIFRRQLAEYGIGVVTGTVVNAIDWSSLPMRVQAHNAEGASTFSAACALVTLPLEVLKQPARVQFIPPLPREKLDAMKKLEMGKVIRVVLRFRHRFWDHIASTSKPKRLSNLSFLLSEDEWFPTWWTAMPEKYPIFTGWAPFQSGERLSGRDTQFVVQQSLEALARLMQLDKNEIERDLDVAHFHDWQSDPFSMGAYSYGKVGADGAQSALAAPLENRLFLAGEATDVTGNNGTVHGAIASGYRAAKEIIKRS